MDLRLTGHGKRGLVQNVFLYENKLGDSHSSFKDISDRSVKVLRIGLSIVDLRLRGHNKNMKKHKKLKKTQKSEKYQNYRKYKKYHFWRPKVLGCQIHLAPEFWRPEILAPSGIQILGDMDPWVYI